MNYAKLIMIVCDRFEALITNADHVRSHDENLAVVRKLKYELRKALNNLTLNRNLERLEKANLNLVTCGDCGCTILHRRGLSELICEECGFYSDISDFPDLYGDRPNKILGFTSKIPEIEDFYTHVIKNRCDPKTAKDWEFFEKEETLVLDPSQPKDWVHAILEEDDKTPFTKIKKEDV
jgi:hypothetical protein